jgi:asparagine synthase (glutamine-hydrolysing)
VVAVVSGVGVCVVPAGAPVGSVVASLVEPVGHRGPAGVWCDELVGVGVASLGGEPVVEEASGVVVVADVRLDNRAELVSALGGEAGRSDAVLIGAAYRRWGEGCAARLLGDFAFVVWDGRRRRVVAARDAMGMRALYWWGDGQRLLLGTEIKQLLAAGVPSRLFEPAIAAHLAGVFAPLSWTCFEGVSALEPAHVLVADERGVRTWRYWEVDPDLRIRYRDERGYAEHLRELFTDAVRVRMRGSGPVGLLLSGGMDSGSVAATAGWLRQRETLPELITYSWAFEELPECDERGVSRLITEPYGLRSVPVPADDAWPLAGYPDHGPDPDEPYVGVYQALIDRTLEHAVADGVTTVLGGDRGDLVNGPTGLDYVHLARTRRWRALREQVRLHGDGTGETVPVILARYLVGPGVRKVMTRAARGAQTTRGSSASPDDTLLPPWVPPDLARSTALTDLVARAEPVAPYDGDIARSWRYQMVFAPLHVRGVVWSERGYARHGLGFADPWSDRRLAEFALAIPQQVITRPGSGDKRLARAAAQGILPERARAAVSKVLPSPLYRRALREDAGGTVASLVRADAAADAGFIRPGHLAAAYERFLAGDRLRHEFWWALTLEMWLRASRP